MLGRLAGNVCVRVITHKTRSSQGATRWPFIRLLPAHRKSTGAIRQARAIDRHRLQYLLTTAKIESNFNPTAQASTSSAKGLYQFIDQTWLGTMKQDGRWVASQTEWRHFTCADVTGAGRAVSPLSGYPFITQLPTAPAGQHKNRRADRL